MNSTVAWICTDGCLFLHTVVWFYAALVALIISIPIYLLASLSFRRRGKVLSKSKKFLFFLGIFLAVGLILLPVVSFLLYDNPGDMYVRIT
jgi:hypothetical protein